MTFGFALSTGVADVLRFITYHRCPGFSRFYTILIETSQHSCGVFSRTMPNNKNGCPSLNPPTGRQLTPKTLRLQTFKGSKRQNQQAHHINLKCTS